MAADGRQDGGVIFHVGKAGCLFHGEVAFRAAVDGPRPER